MALRNQPYIPLYVKDFATDERLMECSASATGVYVRIMCIMHKSEPYGTLLLRQKDKQNDEQILNFAVKFAKYLPYELPIILDSLKELITENVLQIEGDYLIQKRMKRDGEISIIRSKSGNKGGQVTKKKIKDFAQANTEANTVANSVYENVIIDYNTLSNYYKSTLSKFLIETFKEHKPEFYSEIKTFEMIVVEMNKIWKKHKPDYTFLEEADYPALLQIAYLIAKVKKISKDDAVNNEEKKQLIIKSFDTISEFLKNTTNKFFFGLNLGGISKAKNFQSLIETMKDLTPASKDEKLEKNRITHEEYFK